MGKKSICVTMRLLKLELQVGLNVSKIIEYIGKKKPKINKRLIFNLIILNVKYEVGVIFKVNFENLYGRVQN